ncbi:hypothetical protein [Botrimarina sp.]|uniref:hypothetical protein n=1 Tax=Botrimarina sp. TaxID=2795802 RepID=UPI0032EB83F3
MGKWRLITLAACLALAGGCGPSEKERILIDIALQREIVAERRREHLEALADQVDEETNTSPDGPAAVGLRRMTREAAAVLKDAEWKLSVLREALVAG